MNKLMKTRLKTRLHTVDELQYVRHGDKAPNPFVENGPKEKQSNLDPSDVNAVTGGNYVPLRQDQLTGEGVELNGSIWHEIGEKGSYPADSRSCRVDMHSPFGVLENVGYQRRFKKDGILYDLTSNEPLNRC